MTETIPSITPMSVTPSPLPTLQHARPWFASIHATSAGTSRGVDHVSNIEFVRWLDRAAELHLDSLGWTRGDLFASGRMWFVARHEIDYRAEVLAGDDLVLATWVRDLKRAKSWRDTVIWRNCIDEDDEPCIVCTASTLWVHVDLETRRPCRVDHSMAEAFDLLHPRTGSTA
jgi:acyl-CoA thioester hydrolase